MSDFTMKVLEHAHGNKVGNTPVYACMKKDQVAVLERAKGKFIQCTSGLVWVTIENDKEDHLLGPNDTLVIPNRGKAVLSGRGCYIVE